LNIEGISMLSDDSLREIAAKLPMLRELHLGLSLFSDNAFEVLSSRCKCLEALSLTSLPLITDHSLLSVVDNIDYRLQSLRIQNCRGITDVSLNQFAFRHRSLQSLMISNCPSLSEGAIANLIVSTAIRRLQLWYQSFEDSAIVRLLNAAPQIALQELYLVHCSVSLPQLQLLKNALPHLSATHVEFA
jgi:hypothetical protein